MDANPRDYVCWWSVPYAWVVSGSRNKRLPSDVEGTGVDTWSSVSWPERVEEEQGGQGRGMALERW